MILANDKLPRAISRDGSLKTDAEWEVSSILIRRGASLGAGVVVLPGVNIGEFAMIGAGALVTRDVPAHGLAYGNPARLHGYVCQCGHQLARSETDEWRCDRCDESYTL